MRRWNRLAAVLMLAAFGGCGTVCNLVSDDPQVYGGVRGDVELFRHPLCPHTTYTDQAGLCLVGFVAAEACASLVGDTLTLPLVIVLRQHPRANPRDASAPGGLEIELPGGQADTGEQPSVADTPRPIP